ncbi:HopJ type III effector protein [Thalassotalea agariperforans]
MSVAILLERLSNSPDEVNFDEVIAVINDFYHYTPTRFVNGDAVNEQGTNEGSCKIFAFAKLNGLSEQATLACFGHYYREDVLEHPEANDHANIRNFMVSGWAGVSFDAPALSLR